MLRTAPVRSNLDVLSYWLRSHMQKHDYSIKHYERRSPNYRLECKTKEDMKYYKRGRKPEIDLLSTNISWWHWSYEPFQHQLHHCMEFKSIDALAVTHSHIQNQWGSLSSRWYTKLMATSHSLAVSFGLTAAIVAFSEFGYSKSCLTTSEWSFLPVRSSTDSWNKSWRTNVTNEKKTRDQNAMAHITKHRSFTWIRSTSQC